MYSPKCCLNCIRFEHVDFKAGRKVRCLVNHVCDWPVPVIKRDFTCMDHFYDFFFCLACFFTTSWKVWILSLQQHTGVSDHDDRVLILRLGQLCQLNHRKHNLKYQMAQVNCGIKTARKIGQSDALCACLWSHTATTNICVPVTRALTDRP